jgi:hypothetical protein
VPETEVCSRCGHNLQFFSPDITMTGSRRILKCDRREKRTNFWSENLKRRDHLEVLGIVERIIFKLILKKQG